MAAEVATSPSQASTGGSGGAVSGVVGVASHSTGPKSPFRFNSPSSSSIAHVSPPQKYQTQSQSQYKSSASPNDGASSSSFFSHRQQRLPLSSLGSALSPAQDRSIPRGLPPMMTGTSPALGGGGGGGVGGGGGLGTGAMDARLPMSPGSVAMGLNSDNLDALSGDPTAPRKRSKVSRACDECRRKKVGFA